VVQFWRVYVAPVHEPEQSPQARSEVKVHATVCVSLAKHGAVQLAQKRLVDGVHAVNSKVPAVQLSQARQTRLVVAVHGTASYEPRPHGVEHAEHARLVELVHGIDS
jgi:hypothetical protein